MIRLQRLLVPTDFSECYLCHAEGPMLDNQGNRRQDTAFQYHGLHITGISSGFGSTQPSIDTAAAGTGDAICAECHFRTHGTAEAFDQEQQGRYRRLDVAEVLEAARVPGAADLTRDGCLRLWPHRHQTDGFFAAVWERL